MNKEHLEKICLVDMDGTLVNYMDQLDSDLSKLKSPEESSFDLYSDNWPEHIENRISLIKKQPNWWLNLPNIQLGHDVLDMARNIGYDIHVLTKGPSKNSSAWSQKLQWCRDKLPHDVKVTITEDKGLVYGTVLVDDYPQYMSRWLKWRPRGLGIMPVNKGNKDYSHPNVILYDGNNKQEVQNALTLAFERLSGELKIKESM